MTTQPVRKKPTHFFQRERDGSVRVRMKWSNDEATMIEEAAGDTPVLEWLYEKINAAAAAEVKKARRQRHIAPPKEHS